MEPQQTISDALRQVGLVEEAQDALTTTIPWLLRRYALLAIESAMSDTRLEVARKIMLALDDPANGGPGWARDYEIRKHAHPMKPDTFVYRIYDTAGRDVGLMYEDRDMVLKTLVATLVVRNIAYNDADVTPWPSSPR
jgi:hypothetical protein